MSLAVMNGQDDDKNKDQLHVPTITVEPSSSVCMNMSLSGESAPSQPTGEQPQPAELDDLLPPQLNHVPEVLRKYFSDGSAGAQGPHRHGCNQAASKKELLDLGQLSYQSRTSQGEVE